MQTRPADELEQMGQRARARQRGLQPARLELDQVEEVQRTRLEIQARTGIETTNSEVLVQFFRKCFGPWKDEVLSYARRTAVPQDGDKA